MTEIMAFEKQAIRILVSRTIDANVIEEVLEKPDGVDYDYNGHGYNLTISHPLLPNERTVCRKPYITAETDDVVVGFVIFLGEREICIDAHPFCEAVPDWFRDSKPQLHLHRLT